jgi:hypothetical protein
MGTSLRDVPVTDALCTQTKFISYERGILLQKKYASKCLVLFASHISWRIIIISRLKTLENMQLVANRMNLVIFGGKK